MTTLEKTLLVLMTLEALIRHLSKGVRKLNNMNRGKSSRHGNKT